MTTIRKTEPYSAPSSLTRRVMAGFSLVELLVVIGIITVLISMLLPSLQKAKAQANAVVCKSNMRDMGVALIQYAQENRGWMYPPSMGANKPAKDRWPVVVFKVRPNDPASATVENWTPKIMTCPADFTGAEVQNDPINYTVHSYVLNDHLKTNVVRYSSKDLGGLTPSQVVVLGEKRSTERDYYMNINQGGARTDFPRVVEKYRHGVYIGSNYLYMDGHVDTAGPSDAIKGIDPWSVPTADSDTATTP